MLIMMVYPFPIFLNFQTNIPKCLVLWISQSQIFESGMSLGYLRSTQPRAPAALGCFGPKKQLRPGRLGLPAGGGPGARSTGAEPYSKAGPGIEAGHARNSRQRTAYSRACRAGLSRRLPEPAERGRASWCEGERSRRRHADDTLQRTKNEGGPGTH